MKNFMLFLLSTILVFINACEPSEKEETATENRLQWWDEARFGMFIHWGVYAVPAGIYHGEKIKNGGEWIMLRAKIPVSEYKDYAKEFNPVNYDPENWVKMAKAAGMKYIVITSKHHDGFALFDSKVTDWDVVDATPYGKDLLRPLAEACRNEGMRLGFYYSQAQDWTHPGGAAYRDARWDSAQAGDMDEYIDNIAVPQVREILENYGDLDILWWDTPVNMTPERAAKFLPIIEEHPNLITNNRLGGGIEGDTETPENYIPATGYDDRRFEVCMVMNDNWGYVSFDQDWKSTRELLLKLSDIASKGGNFLLNVGPTAVGEIPQPSIDRLQQIGEWMKVNGAAIYGTKASPFPYLPWGKATQKGQKLYLHVIDWPDDRVLKVPLINKAKKASLLSSPGSKLKIHQKDDRIEISVPETAPDSILSIVVLEIKGEPRVHPIPSQGKSVEASSFDSTASYGNLLDGNPRNEWKAARGETTSTIDIDLEEEISIANITFIEPWRVWHGNSQEFVLQRKVDGEWVEIARGKTTGAGYSHDFEPLTARYFRLIITGPKGQEPRLNEVVLNREV